MDPGFTSPDERFSYVLVKIYSLPVLIVVWDTPGPCFTLGEPLTFKTFMEVVVTKENTLWGPKF
jgi:hypothetical protein